MLRWFRRSAAPTTNDEWLDALRGPDRDQALAALRPILVRGLRAAFRDRVPHQIDAFAEDVAQEALLKILDHLDAFRGEARFTTWAHKIAARLALTKLRRKRWENVSLEDLTTRDDGAPRPHPSLTDAAPRPDDQATLAHYVEVVQQVMRQTLTETQRTALEAVMQHDMPITEVARRLGVSRNTLYKRLHDARKNLKAALRERGIAPEEILAEVEAR